MLITNSNIILIMWRLSSPGRLLLLSSTMPSYCLIPYVLMLTYSPKLNFTQGLWFQLWSFEKQIAYRFQPLHL